MFVCVQVREPVVSEGCVCVCGKGEGVCGERGGACFEVGGVYGGWSPVLTAVY